MAQEAAAQRGHLRIYFGASAGVGKTYAMLGAARALLLTSLEEVWRSETRRSRLKDMLEGRLLDVCARCQGLK